MTGNLSHDAPPAAQQPQPRPAVQPSVAPPPPPPRPREEQQAPRPPLGIDPEIWPAIRQSAAWLARNENAFIQQLHYEITKPGSDPAGAPAADIWVFCQRMVQSLLWTVLTDQPLGVIADTLRQVGAQNWVDGFPDTLYGDVPYALVHTVRYLTVYDWSSSMGSAWISYFLWIKPHLLAGAQQAAEQHAAERHAAEQYAAERYAAARQAAERQAAAEREAAEREAARVKALSRGSRGGQAQEAGDVNLESVAIPLDDDDDDENVGYGQIMVSMTRNFRQEHRRRPS